MDPNRAGQGTIADRVNENDLPQIHRNVDDPDANPTAKTQIPQPFMTSCWYEKPAPLIAEMSSSNAPSFATFFGAGDINTGCTCRRSQLDSSTPTKISERRAFVPVGTDSVRPLES